MTRPIAEERTKTHVEVHLVDRKYTTVIMIQSDLEHCSMFQASKERNIRRGVLRLRPRRRRETDPLIHVLRRPDTSVLHPPCTRLANALVHLQATLDVSWCRVTVLAGEDDTEGGCIFECLDGSPASELVHAEMAMWHVVKEYVLALVWQHGVSSFAKQCDLPFAPVLIHTSQPHHPPHMTKEAELRQTGYSWWTYSRHGIRSNECSSIARTLGSRSP